MSININKSGYSWGLAEKNNSSIMKRDLLINQNNSLNKVLLFQNNFL